ncbi:alpha/beta hydrolase-fold protein [Tamlana sp. 2201CG12-4]|uniref:alpha/beta hydrolase n=1 Tax=Tamlana sp. 2201CG12-4 TaxID=3112582 RepID=UPI002DBBAE72|nr:alpha/beta hydrolase-fold protein [Tamlana sp. 2201CG12-4]MEC3906769.1 alpha/beta hydrolase-fold protein [Tamlana sp. 2201CG12-4]
MINRFDNIQKWLALWAIPLLCFSCLDKKKDNDNPVLGDEVVTFIVNKLPEGHDFDDDVFISGDFEGWSGGRSQFKLKKEDGHYRISIPKYREAISFKFTKGDWGSVECALNNNPIENRTYTFESQSETVEVNIVKWNTDNDADKPSTASKQVKVYATDFAIPQLGRTRKISVYLPPDYEASSKTYPVLYIQDGQNVFDAKTSYSGEWEVDETLDELYEESGFGLIVVAIDHGAEKRIHEYSAWDSEKHGKGEAKLYLDFIVNTLKPEIDKNFRTKTNPESTAVMGSSMGGLFAHYAAFERPDVFGLSGVFSPSFWYSKAIFTFTENRLSNANGLRVYFLAGEKEGSDMVQNVETMITLLANNGFSKAQFKKRLVPGGTHSEVFWKNEFKTSIKWLFGLETSNTFQPYPKAKLSSGTLMRLEAYPSKYIQSRPVDVWLPEDYSEEKKYAVLYMHDGQMLFDATSTWNKQEWKVDEWASKLINEGKTKDFIVVGIHNISEIRWQDLFPQKAFDNLEKKEKDRLRALAVETNKNIEFYGDNYLKFLVEELMPMVNSEFSVYRNKANTYVMGSSMGGLMSMYAICEYPNVFSGAACISTHWPGATPIENNPFPDAIFKYMKTHLPDSNTHKMYFDYGTETLDAHYPQYAPKVDEILKEKGYTEANFKNLKFEGTDHSENAWNQRLDIPLMFLLRK